MMQRMQTLARQPRASPRGAGPILGVDPGLQRTGYGIVTPASGVDQCRVIEAGVVRLDPRQPLEQRLLELERALDELISTHRPCLLACEQLYGHYKHPRTAIIMAHARGAILTLAARRGVSIVNVGATHMKKLLTGSGRASKPQMQRAVAGALNLPQIPEPHDVADALAVALAGLRMRDAEFRRTRAAQGARV
jgi:crossover junction endodeoxyribonuclease RuvC